MTDLLIAGGGPAGLGVAIQAALSGLSATVIEPRTGVIDKACGEGLMPPAVAALVEMGVELPVSYPFVGVRYVSDAGTVDGRFNAGPGLGVRRLALHEAMRSRALQLGVEIIEGRVDRFGQDERGVEAEGRRARYGVVADGLMSPLRAKLGLNLLAPRKGRAGVRRHFRVRPWSEFVEVHWSEHAEAYVTPVAEDLVGVAILFRTDASVESGQPPFDRWLGQFPGLMARLGTPLPPFASSTRGAGPFEQRVRARVAGRLMLVGDASGYLDPITGEGIRLALEEGAALVRAVEVGRPSDYEREWRRITRRYWWMTSGLLAVARVPWTRRLIVPVCRAVPTLFRWGLNALAGG